MTKRSLSRALPWIAGFVLVAGLVAFGTVYIFDGDETVEVQEPVTTGEAVTNTTPTNVALDPEARKVAGKFIITAVTREKLAESWKITHPELRAGFTLEEWKGGDIPVQYYPADAIDKATFKINESYAGEAVLEVALLPKEGEEVKPQIFYIGLKKMNGKWLVYYWAPRSAIPVPATGDG
jgi:hypothetical protein